MKPEIADVVAKVVAGDRPARKRAWLCTFLPHPWEPWETQTGNLTQTIKGVQYFAGTYAKSKRVCSRCGDVQQKYAEQPR